MKKLDYLILGGGISGLYSGRRLLRERNIRNFMILEGKNRLGGRIQTYNKLQNKNYADVGAQWISPAHKRIQQLCKDYQIELFPTYSQGDSIYELQNDIYKDSDESNSTEFSNYFFEENDKFIQSFLNYLKQNNNYLDQNIPKITLLDYLNNYLEKKKSLNKFKSEFNIELLKKHLISNLETVSAYPIQNISLNQAIFMEQSGSDFSTLDGEFDQMRVKNGMESIIQKLSQEIDHNKHLELNTKVIEIIQHSNDNVEVKVEVPLHKNNNNINDDNYPKQEISYFTKNLIVSIPLFILKNVKLNLLENDQKNSQRLIKLIQNYEVGNVIKTFVVYDKPFWRQQGLNGCVFCGENEYISDMYDMSCSNTENGIIQLFSVGSKANLAQQLSQDQFKQHVIKSLVKLFGKQAYNYFDYYSHSFINDQFVRGGYAGIQSLDSLWGEYPGTQEVMKFNSLKSQNVFFIGTETSQTFNGYMEGAIASADHLFDQIISK